jgi:hypothetical protein
VPADGALVGQNDLNRNPHLVEGQNQRAPMRNAARLHRAWLLDPRLPGSTVPNLNVRDSKRVERRLADRNLCDARPLQATERPPTPRCWERMTWTRIDEQGARRRLELTLKDEAASWRRLEERCGDVE